MRADDGRVVPTFICQALRGEDITVYGDGSQTRSFCFVSDTVAGLIKLMESGCPGPVNIGNPDEMTVLDFAKLIASAVGGGRGIVFRDLPVDDPRIRRPDITKARSELGWEPLIPLSDGLAKTVEYFRGKLCSSSC